MPVAALDFKNLIDWFSKEGRDLPWRKNKSPYHIWVSEIMLQQTRVSVVIPYYLRWIAKYPTVESLAKAEEQEVLKLWEGLGYYSRARNLKKGAQYILEHFEGRLPSSRKALLQIPGIGSYTAGAIMSFGFQEAFAALDGNVKRVLSRLLAFSKDVQKHAKEMESLLQTLLPNDRGHLVMEALIELGALVCQKQPYCTKCPLKNSCQAHAKGIESSLPVLPKRAKTQSIYRMVICLVHQNQVLLKTPSKEGIMAGLWEFPYIEMPRRETVSDAVVLFENQFGFHLRRAKPMLPVMHTFTRYKSSLFPFIAGVELKQTLPTALQEYTWFSQKHLRDLPFSSGHRQILRQLESEIKNYLF